MCRVQQEYERLVNDLQRSKDEIAMATHEKEILQQRLIEAQQEGKQERDVRNRSELRVCALESDLQATNLRLTSAADEVVELKTKVKQKEDEMSNLLQNMSQIQTFATTANAKLESEKVSLVGKAEILETKCQHAETIATEITSKLREVQLERDVCERMHVSRYGQTIYNLSS